MSRLIDADALFKAVTEGKYTTGNIFKDMELQQFIKEQPTAFDTEKVVEQLEEKQYAYIRDNGDYEESKYHAFEEAIDIVKKGGVK